MCFRRGVKRGIHGPDRGGTRRAGRPAPDQLGADRRLSARPEFTRPNESRFRTDGKVLRLTEGADLLIAAAPVYGGSYPGLFKQFFDLFDLCALATSRCCCWPSTAVIIMRWYLIMRCGRCSRFFQAWPSRSASSGPPATSTGRRCSARGSTAGSSWRCPMSPNCSGRALPGEPEITAVS